MALNSEHAVSGRMERRAGHLGASPSAGAKHMRPEENRSAIQLRGHRRLAARRIPGARLYISFDELDDRAVRNAIDFSNFDAPKPPIIYHAVNTRSFVSECRCDLSDCAEPIELGESNDISESFEFGRSD